MLVLLLGSGMPQRIYGHVDSIDEMGGGRIAVHVDAIAADVFDRDDDRSTSEEGLGFLRIVSTLSVLQKMMGEGAPLTAGDWVEASIGLDVRPTRPLVWALQVRNNRFVGDDGRRLPLRGRLISLQRLASASDTIDPRPLGASVPSSRTKGSALKSRYSLLKITAPITPQRANALLRLNSRAWGLSEPVALDVGQASFNVITPSLVTAPLLYFDVGQPIWFHVHSAPASFSPPCSDGGVVILSHWDTDHYAYGRQEPKFHEKHWLAPAQASVGPNANRFAQLLDSRGRLLLVGTGKSNRHRRGVRIIRCSGSSLNGSGLALHLRTFGRDILFTGDAEYHEIPSMGGVRLSGVQLPHHGGKLSVSAIIPPADVPPKRAVVSCGLPNRYGHPDTDTVSAHQRAGWNVDVTANTLGVPRGPRFL